jgi:phosphohistidine phosphatase
MATTKTLFLMRHAEAEPLDAGQDHARKLTKHGEEQASLVGQQLSTLSIKPEVILVSNAMRTTQTVQILISEVWPDGTALPQVTYMPELYNCSPTDVLSAIDNLPDHVQEALIIGHNPSLTEVAIQLSNNKQLEMSTASIIGLKWNTLALEEPWVSALAGTPKFVGQ